MRIISFSLLLMMSLTSAAVAQSELKSVKKVYDQFRKTHKTLIFDQQYSISAQGVEFISENKVFIKGSKKRIESKFQASGMPGEMQMKLIVNGDDSWMYSPMRGLEKASDQNPMVQMSKRDFLSFPSGAKFLKTDILNSVSCYVFSVSENGLDTQIWYNKTSGAVQKIMTQTPQGDMVLMIKKLKKLKDGFEIPANIEIMMNQMTVGMIVINNIQENPEISDELFDPQKLVPAE